MLLLSLSKAGLFACYCALSSTGWSIWCLCSWDSCSWLLALSSSMTTWLFAVASFLGCLRPSWWLNWFGLPIYLHHVTACQGLFRTKVFFSVAPWFSTEGSSGGVKSIKRKCEEYWDNRSNIIISWFMMDIFGERERECVGGRVDILKITCCCQMLRCFLETRPNEPCLPFNFDPLFLRQAPWTPRGLCTYQACGYIGRPIRGGIRDVRIQVSLGAVLGAAQCPACLVSQCGSLATVGRKMVSRLGLAVPGQIWGEWLRASRQA